MGKMLHPRSRPCCDKTCMACTFPGRDSQIQLKELEKQLWQLCTEVIEKGSLKMPLQDLHPFWVQVAFPGQQVTQQANFHHSRLEAAHSPGRHVSLALNYRLNWIDYLH